MCVLAFLIGTHHLGAYVYSSDSVLSLTVWWVYEPSGYTETMQSDLAQKYSLNPVLPLDRVHVTLCLCAV